MDIINWIRRWLLRKRASQPSITEPHGPEWPWTEALKQASARVPRPRGE